MKEAVTKDHVLCFHVYEMSEVCKSTREKAWTEVQGNGHGVSYWSDKDDLILIVMMMIVQLYNYVTILMAIEL